MATVKMRALPIKLLHHLAYPYYKLWKATMTQKVRSVSPLIGFPMLAYMETEMDKVYWEGGFAAVQDAAVAKLKAIGEGWELTFDAVTDPALAIDLVVLPSIAWINLHPQVVPALKSCTWYDDGEQLYLSVQNFIDQDPATVFSAIADTYWDGYQSTRRRIQIKNMTIVPDAEKRISRERGLYRASDIER